MENFKLNPSNAINKSNNINTISNLCYEISSAYGKTFGEDVEKNLKSQCSEMISEKKHQMGLTDCYMKRPAPPPVWNQTSHFFPDLLKTLNDPKKAYTQCCLEANKSKYPNESLDRCKLDYLTVVKPDTVENYQIDNEIDNDIDNDINNEIENDRNYYSFFMHIIIIILIIVLMYYYKKSKKQF